MVWNILDRPEGDQEDIIRGAGWWYNMQVAGGWRTAAQDAKHTWMLDVLGWNAACVGVSGEESDVGRVGGWRKSGGSESVIDMPDAHVSLPA